jgi:hypothetical protein
MLLVATTCVAAAMYLLMFPTVRAQRFARFINLGPPGAAEAMLPKSMDENSCHFRTVHKAICVELEPLTLTQLLHGERRVIVTEELVVTDNGSKPNSVDSRTAQFIVMWNSIEPGWHSLYNW